MAAEPTLVAAPISETRPGVRTTEFWTTLFVNALGTFELVFGGINVENDKVMIALAIVNGLYGASRGLAKQGIPAPVE